MVEKPQTIRILLRMIYSALRIVREVYPYVSSFHSAALIDSVTNLLEGTGLFLLLENNVNISLCRVGYVRDFPFSVALLIGLKSLVVVCTSVLSVAGSESTLFELNLYVGRLQCTASYQ